MAILDQLMAGLDCVMTTLVGNDYFKPVKNYFKPVNVLLMTSLDQSNMYIYNYNKKYKSLFLLFYWYFWIVSKFLKMHVG